jgi:hypothetical protein
VREVAVVSFDRCAPWRSAQERSAQFGDEFFTDVGRVTEALAAEVAVETARMLRPVCQLVRLRGGVALGVAEGLRVGSWIRSAPAA